jgi:hypothetical protein
MITKNDFEYCKNVVMIIGRYLNYKHKIEIIEYSDGTYGMINYGPSDECHDSFNFIDQDVPETVSSLDEAIEWCNYMIKNKQLSEW